MLDWIVVAIVCCRPAWPGCAASCAKCCRSAAWVGAAFAALFASHWRGRSPTNYIGDPLFADIAAGVVIFVVGADRLLAHQPCVSQRVQGSALDRWTDRSGLLFGLARGALVVSPGARHRYSSGCRPRSQPAWVADAHDPAACEQGRQICCGRSYRHPAQAGARPNAAEGRTRRRNGTIRHGAACCRSPDAPPRQPDRQAADRRTIPAISDAERKDLNG